MNNQLETLLKNFSMTELNRFKWVLLETLLLNIICIIGIYHNDFFDYLWVKSISFYLFGSILISFGYQIRKEQNAVAPFVIRTDILYKLLWAILICYVNYLSPIKGFTVFNIIVLEVSSLVILLSYLFPKRVDNTRFWEYTCSFILTFIGLYIFCGLLSVVFYFLTVIIKDFFSITFPEELLNSIISVLLLSLPIFLFLSFENRNVQLKSIGNYLKSTKILAYIVLVPVITLYTIILYIYGLKILFLWELPKGIITYSALVLLLLWSLFIYIGYPYRKQKKENKYLLFYNKYYPLFLLPIIFMMMIAIYRRISDYGITQARLYIIFIIGLAVFSVIYNYITKSQKIMQWARIIGVSFFIVSIGPWSFQEITFRILRSRIDKDLNTFHLQDKLPLGQSQIDKIYKENGTELLLNLKLLKKDYSKEASSQYIQKSAYIDTWELQSSLKKEKTFPCETNNSTEMFIPLPKGTSKIAYYSYLDYTLSVEEDKKQQVDYMLAYPSVDKNDKLKLLLDLNKIFLETNEKTLLIPTNRQNTSFILTSLKYDPNHRWITFSGYLCVN